MRCCEVSQLSACNVSVGLCPPVVGKFEAPSIPRFGTSCEKPYRSPTDVAESGGGLIGYGGPKFTWAAEDQRIEFIGAPDQP
jgi:hypothetical protein